MRPKYGLDYVHIAVLKETQKKIAIMSAVQSIRMYDLVREWADSAWLDLQLAGKVSDKMLEPAESSVQS